MERLTKSNGYAENEFMCNTTCITHDCRSCDQFYKILDKLGSLENLEEDNKLFIPPCKVGDNVYFIPSIANCKLNVLNNMLEQNKVFTQSIRRIIIGTGCVNSKWYLESEEEPYFAFKEIHLEENYGVTWFLSYEEAQAKLDELKSVSNSY